MNKNQTIMLAMAGATLLASSQAQAGGLTSYAYGDLLLNFRNTQTDTGNDVVVDMGNVSTFLSTVATDGGTVVLDNGTGYSATAGINYFSAGDLQTEVGSFNQVGMSAIADAVQSGTATQKATLWLSRVVTSGQGSSSQVSGPNASLVKGYIQQIGGEASSAGGDGNQSTLANSVNAAVVLASAPGSYQNQGQAPGDPTTINYQGVISVSGSALEAAPSAGTVYEALWTTPPTGTSATYDGYFAFEPNGEVVFSTGTVSAIPEPSTYALFAVVGLAALAFRRQLRSLAA
jgi:hypothetical protein